jgi:hypothetical protein
VWVLERSRIRGHGLPENDGLHFARISLVRDGPHLEGGCNENCTHLIHTRCEMKSSLKHRMGSMDAELAPPTSPLLFRNLHLHQEVE